MANESSFYGTAISTRGTPLVGQSVAICSQPANTSTTPCSPLVNTFTDITGATLTGTPGITTTDSFGNFHFYLPSGIYTVQIYGPQVTSPVVQKDFFVPVGNSTSATFSTINKVVYGAGNGMVCDGVTDDTAAAQATLDLGGKGAQVIFPPGTCLVNGQLNVYDSSWISGAGKSGTSIKRKNGANLAQPVFSVANGGAFGSVGNVTFSDFTVDGNAVNQTIGQDNIYAATTVTNFTLKRMRLINSWFHGLQLNTTTQNTDLLIADCDFETNGIVAAACVGIAQCQDLFIQHPLRVRISRNRSHASQNFLVTVPSGTDGQMVIEENVVDSCLGFAVALGGVQVASTITRNTFNCPTSTQNIIDLANATDTVVSSNVITMGTASNGIGDLPPALRVSVTGNVIIGNITGPGTSSCIALGGSDVVIDGNVCRDAAGNGIVLSVANTGPSKSVVVSNNVVKNCSRSSSGAFAGISTFLQSGGSAVLSGVVIQGNRSYDDQGSPTQGYGIAINLPSGQATGYSDINILNNDVRGNKTAGILNNASPSTNFLIGSNPGGESVVLGSPTLAGVIAAIPLGGTQDGLVINAGGNTSADSGSLAITNKSGTGLTRFGAAADGTVHMPVLTSLSICLGQTGLPCPAAPTLKILGGGLIAGGTAAVLSGTGTCATITNQAGGAWAGTFKCTGTAGAATVTITPGATAPNGWICLVEDETTRADLLQQTSHSTTTCTLTATAIAANDVMVWQAIAF